MDVKKNNKNCVKNFLCQKNFKILQHLLLSYNILCLTFKNLMKCTFCLSILFLNNLNIYLYNKNF